MGRDAFLTRLALGRSAHELPERFPAGTRQYDSRGHPVNPQARALGRVLRDAQNDVLAAVGVVERKRVSLTAAAPPPPKDPLVVKQVEAEELSGTSVAVVSTLAKYAGLWWVYALLDRILTYDYPQEHSFAELLGAQYRSEGPAAFYFAGLPAHLISMLTNDGEMWAYFAISALDEAFLRSNLSRDRRMLYHHWRPRIRNVISITVELIFAPIVLHSASQRLFLTSASQLLPPVQMFNLFSAGSPFMTLTAPLQLSMTDVIGCVSSIIVSPAVMTVSWRRALAHVQRLMYEPLERNILAPDNPDVYTTEIVADRRKDVMPLTPTNHPWAEWFFGCLQWNQRDNPRDVTSTGVPDGLPVEDGHFSRGQTVRTANTEGPNEDNRPGTPVGLPPSPFEPQTPPTRSRIGFPTPPISPTESFRNPDNERDATVRIASRDEGSGVVSLEIALPEELQETQSFSRSTLEARRPQETLNERHHQRRERERTKVHRITQLAEEPAEMLMTWLNFTFSDWMLLPLKAIGLRLLAGWYLRSLDGSNGGRQLPAGAQAIYSAWPAPSVTRNMGVYISRVGLCCALEASVGLAAWGLEWVVVTGVGKRYFGWGRR